MKPALLKDLLFYAAIAWLTLASGMPVCGQDHPTPWCKVRCGDGSTGSGALVDRNEKLGLVVTAFHVVRDIMPNGKQASTVVCEFTNGDRAGATVVSFNDKRDLCALIIYRPNVRPVKLAPYTGQGVHTVYGFPGGEGLRPVSGHIVDDTRFLLAQGDYPVTVLSAPTIPGQSGGAVVTVDGMVGVMWGCDGEGHANMTCGKPFDEFMVSLTQCYSCDQGRCWQPSPQYQPGGHVIVSNPNPVKPPTSTPAVDNSLLDTVRQNNADLEKLRAEWELHLKKYADVKPCQCDQSDMVTRAEYNALLAKLEANQKIVNEINNTVGAQQPYAPPSAQEQAAAIAPFLEHSATIQLPDGQVKTQTKPLNEPLQFTQHSMGVK